MYVFNLNIHNLIPAPQYPCSNLKMMLNDTTQCDDDDFNANFMMTDISFNQA